MIKQKSNKTVIKPWGKYVIVEKKQTYWIKKLFLQQGASISLQSHKSRFEIWVVLSGKVDVVKGNEHRSLEEGEFLQINKEEKHRLTGLTASWLLEVAFGQPRERDITRFQDDYGRVK